MQTNILIVQPPPKKKQQIETDTEMAIHLQKQFDDEINEENDELDPFDEEDNFLLVINSLKN